MFHKILVPVDFSDKNEAAIKAVIDLARPKPEAAAEERAEVHLLHVIETVDHLEYAELEDFYRKLENRNAARLATLVERLAESGVRATSEIVFGKRAEEIVRFAHLQEIDLILLSAHQVDREHPALAIGSISYRVAIAARCAVMLVK
jgi:nucleotide-binding universal stress UspA family protein